MNIATTARVKVPDRPRAPATRSQGDFIVGGLPAYTKVSGLYPGAIPKSICEPWPWTILNVIITAILDSVELHQRDSSTFLCLSSSTLREAQQVVHRDGKCAIIVQHQVCIEPYRLHASLPLQIIVANHPFARKENPLEPLDLYRVDVDDLYLSSNPCLKPFGNQVAVHAFNSEESKPVMII